jgi:hypothetical protein
MDVTGSGHRVDVKLRSLSRHTGVHLMNASIHRVGLVIAALAVVAVVGGALIAGGYLGARSQASGGPASVTVQRPPLPTAAAEFAPPQVVYVRPAPSPKVIHVTQPAPAAPPRVVHITVPGTRSENESESEGGDG